MTRRLVSGPVLAVVLWAPGCEAAPAVPDAGPGTDAATVESPDAALWPDARAAPDAWIAATDRATVDRCAGRVLRYAM